MYYSCRVMKTGSKDKGVSFRPKTGIRNRLDDLSLATERPKTFFLDKALEAHLPELERKYAIELEELRKKRGRFPPHQPTGVALNDAATVNSPSSAIAPGDTSRKFSAVLNGGADHDSPPQSTHSAPTARHPAKAPARARALPGKKSKSPLPDPVKNRPSI